jgi:hypothetical protein
MIKEFAISDEEKSEIILACVREILNIRFGESSQKSVVKIGKDNLNFACPYCGDSSSNQFKKRGNLYLSSLSFHCFNCEMHANLDKFLRDFDLLKSGWDKLRELAVQSLIFKHNKTKSFNPDTLIESIFDPRVKDFMFDREELKTKLHLTEIEGSAIEVYLEKRMQRDFENFLWDPKYKRLFVLNICRKDNKVIGWQIRNFGMREMQGQKYMTYKWSKARDILKRNESIEDLDVQSMDKLSNTFNIFNVDFSKVITIFEGPMDCFLFPNSIALASLHASVPFEFEGFRYLFDYDEPGKKKSMELLKSGQYVFMWKKFLDDNGIKMKKSKVDWNDTIVHCVMNNKRIQGISSYFTNNKYDIVLL